MKKSGFTLAEILISLGIIGVVAALTLPSLNHNTVNAQIGPKLAKAVSSFEQANLALLNNRSIDSLFDTTFAGDDSAAKTNAYCTELTNFMKGTSNGSVITTKDGISYTVSMSTWQPTAGLPPHRDIKTGNTVIIDINGNNAPNTKGEDQFYFTMAGDGSLKAKGSVNWNGAATSADGGTEHWKTQCANDTTPTNVEYCAGSIFEQNLKVLYK